MINDCKKLIDQVCAEIKRHADVSVLGLSGGADSTLVAILCAKALGKENVYGISLPYNEADIKIIKVRTNPLSLKLGVKHLVRPIAMITNAVNDQIYIKTKSELSNTNKGNSRSRSRMCVLYGIAHNISTIMPDKRVRVIGTGNLSEDFIGYDTKGGDALADVFPIGELFKSEVYQLLDYFKNNEVISENDIDRVPTAGLVEGQTDEGDLGHSYADMEKGIRFCMKNYSAMTERKLDEVTAFVWNWHKMHKHKHEAQSVIKLRHLCD